MTTPATMLEPENAWAGQGAVLLDIGGDVGALVVTMPEATVGLEVEIRPVDGQHVLGHGHTHAQSHAHHHGHGHTHDDHRLAHVAVVARPVAGGRLPSLVYGELPSGRYELFAKGHPDDVALRTEVVGGTVTAVDWPR